MKKKIIVNEGSTFIPDYRVIEKFEFKIGFRGGESWGAMDPPDIAIIEKRTEAKKKTIYYC